MEEKLNLLIELLEKGIGWVLKAALGVVTGISVFQAVITPVIDSVKASTLQKVISAIPGIGNAADGVVELVAGSAVVIKKYHWYCTAYSAASFVRGSPFKNLLHSLSAERCGGLYGACER